MLVPSICTSAENKPERVECATTQEIFFKLPSPLVPLQIDPPLLRD